MTPHYPCCERTQLHAGWNLSLRRATVRTTYGRNHVGLGPGTQCQNTDDKLFESHIRAHHEKIRRNELKSEQGSQIIVELQKMSELFRARKMPAPLLKAAGEHPHSGSARHAPLGPPVTSDSCTFSARASITGIWSTVDASNLWNRRSGSECVRSARVCMCLLWSGSS